MPTSDFKKKPDVVKAIQFVDEAATNGPEIVKLILDAGGTGVYLDRIERVDGRSRVPQVRIASDNGVISLFNRNYLLYDGKKFTALSEPDFLEKYEPIEPIA